MEFIIRGTNGGGESEFYGNSDLHYKISEDLRGNHGEGTLGQIAYAIKFIPDGCNFSKYVIARDEKRNAMGYIASSIFFSKNERMTGKDIVTLLDLISDDYCAAHIIENKIQDVNKLKCDSIDKFISQYQSKLKTIPFEDIESYPKGRKKPAYIYYRDINELHSFFDVPYQDVYQEYQTIFFIGSELQDINNPLNPLGALKHDTVSNLTGLIELEDPEYRLQFENSYENSVKIEITAANGKKYNNNQKVRKKTKIQVTYSKPYYDNRKSILGKCHDLEDEFISINEDLKIIIVKNVELNPEIKNLRLKVKKENKDVKDAKDVGINCENSSHNKRLDLNNNNEIKFKGEQIGYKWKIIAQKDTYHGELEFYPKNEGDELVIIMQEHKTVQFQIINSEGTGVQNCKIDISPNHKINKQNEEYSIEFVGSEEINKNWRISIRNFQYDPVSIDYCPKNEWNSEEIKLVKRAEDVPNKATKKYIDVTTNGGTRNNDYQQWEYKKENIVIKSIKPPKGKKFSHFEYDETYKENDYDGRFIAHYVIEESIFTKYKIISLAIAACLIIGVIIYLFLTHKSIPKKLKKIEKYLAQNELNLDTLQKYQDEYCTDDNSLFQYESDSEEDICGKLQNAINLRQNIAEGNVEKLINILSSSPKYNLLQIDLYNINDNYKDSLSKMLLSHSDSLAKVNLDGIVKYISNYLNHLKSKTKPEIGIKTNDTGPKIPVIKDSTILQESSDTDNNTEPISTGYTKADFWKLVNSGNVKIDSFVVLYKKYIDTNDESYIYLKEICTSNSNFHKFKAITYNKRKNAKKIADLK